MADSTGADGDSTVVWIAGASSGLGASMAGRCPWEGATTIDISRSGGGPATEHIAADLAERSCWDALSEDFDTRLAGGVDRAVLVWSVGRTTPAGPVGSLDPDDYADSVTLNSTAPQVVAQRFMAACRRHDVTEVTVALVTGGVAQKVYPGWTTYAVGKAAIEHWVRTVGGEDDDGIGQGATVVAIHPGNVDTPMQDRIRELDPETFPRADKFLSLHEAGELISPDDAADAAWRYLCGGPATGSVTDLREETLPDQ